jgi:hypothetical protein
MKDIFYVYQYLREDGTSYYIGKGSGKRAFDKGRREFQPPKDKSRICILKDSLDETTAFAIERFWIAVCGRKDLGTGILRNLTDGGEGVSNIAEETRQKISIGNKGKIISEESRRKTSKTMKGRPARNKGKPMSESQKKKISDSHKGQTRSPETCRNISLSRKGKPHPISWRGTMNTQSTKAINNGRALPWTSCVK